MTDYPMLTLNDGRQLPQIGFGTYQIDNDKAAEAVRTAVDVGYKMVDTAAVYQNEDGVGDGLARSGGSSPHRSVRGSLAAAGCLLLGSPPSVARSTARRESMFRVGARPLEPATGRRRSRMCRPYRAARPCLFDRSDAYRHRWYLACRSSPRVKRTRRRCPARRCRSPSGGLPCARVEWLGRGRSAA